MPNRKARRATPQCERMSMKMSQFRGSWSPEAEIFRCNPQQRLDENHNSDFEVRVALSP
jgi:hypothetical protein